MLNFDRGVYIIYGPNGRAYVGSTLSFRKRFRTHRRDLQNGTHHCRALQRAYDKYGLEALTFAKIAFVCADDLLKREQEQMDARPGRQLYNSSRTAGNCLGVKHSAATRAKQSALIKGRKHSAETRALLTQLKTGLTYSDATKKKIGDTLSRLTAGRKKATNTSGFAGVNWHKKAQKWAARCRHNKQRYHVGLFDSAESAHSAILAFKARLESDNEPQKPLHCTD